MSFTAQDAMTGAREQHPAFDEERTPDSVLFRQLIRYARDLYVRSVEKNSHLYLTTLSAPLPLADFADGIDLPAHIRVVGVEVDYPSGNRHPATIISPDQRNVPPANYPVYIADGVLYMSGNAADWAGLENIYIDYNPAPTAPSVVTDTVMLPDSAERVIVDHLAFWMSRRQGSYEGQVLPVSQFHDHFRYSEHEYLVEIAQHSRPQLNLVKEVW